jgi:hypothetical protein
MNKIKTSRREFLVKAALGMVVVSAQLFMSACGSSDSSSGGSTATNGGNCDSNGTQLETTGETDGHTHTFQLTAGQIASATTSSVFQVSNIGHTHNVQFSAQEISDLQSNQGVSLTTAAEVGGDGHSHSLSISCA